MGTDKGASKPLLQLLLKDNGKHAYKTPGKTSLERMLACVQRIGLVGTILTSNDYSTGNSSSRTN